MCYICGTLWPVEFRLLLPVVWCGALIFNAQQARCVLCSRLVIYIYFIYILISSGLPGYNERSEKNKTAKFPICFSIHGNAVCVVQLHYIGEETRLLHVVLASELLPGSYVRIFQRIR